MTHTLHRTGTAESLKGDYVVLAMSSRGLNEKGAATKLAEVLRILSKFDPINMGDMRTASIFNKERKSLVEGVTDTSIVHAVFGDISTVENALKALKEANLGMSVVVSGLFDEIASVCRKIGLKPHTVNISLGIWGRTDLLPKESEIMDIVTMCGHAMISRGLVRKLAKDVKSQKITAEEAAKTLARACTCGIFNWKRGSQLVESLAAKM